MKVLSVSFERTKKRRMILYVGHYFIGCIIRSCNIIFEIGLVKETKRRRLNDAIFTFNDFYFLLRKI